MNIKQLTGLVPASFSCECLDEKGEGITVETKIKLNRMKFRDAAQEEFSEAMKNADKDPEVIGKLLADLIAEWEIFEDEANTKMLPITVENIIDRPVDFVMNLSEAVFGRLFPNPQKAAPSVNGSELAAKSSLKLTNGLENGISSALPAVSGK